jgi:hypothetical protein
MLMCAHRRHRFSSLANQFYSPVTRKRYTCRKTMKDFLSLSLSFESRERKKNEIVRRRNEKKKK